MTEFIPILPYWLWAIIIALISVPVAFLITFLIDEGSHQTNVGLFPLSFLILITYSLVNFSDFYERADLESAKSDASDYKIRQHYIWARDSVSFLSERLSARKAMQEKVREDTFSYSPVVSMTIELLENQIRDYEFRTLALKDALIDSDVRQGITSKDEAQVKRNYGILFYRGTGISEINPVDMSIKTIYKGSAASDAGLAEGDMIAEIWDYALNDWSTMDSSFINDLTGYYKSRRHMVVKIDPRNGSRTVGKIGVSWIRSEYAGTPAMTIGVVLKNRAAGMAGLETGDQIVNINDSTLLTHAGFYNHFLNLTTVESTKLGIIRDGLEMDIIVRNDLDTEKQNEIWLQTRGIPYMLDETYIEWVRITEGLKYALEVMKRKQKTLYFLRKVSELDPHDGDKSKEIDKLILEAKKTADRNIQLFKL